MQALEDFVGGEGEPPVDDGAGRALVRVAHPKEPFAGFPHEVCAHTRNPVAGGAWLTTASAVATKGAGAGEARTLGGRPPEPPAAAAPETDEARRDSPIIGRR